MSNIDKYREMRIMDTHIPSIQLQQDFFHSFGGCCLCPAGILADGGSSYVFVQHSPLLNREQQLGSLFLKTTEWTLLPHRLKWRK